MVQSAKKERLKIEVKVIDMQGKVIIEGKDISTIDISNYSTGLYNLQIITGDKIFTNKIIKH